MRSGAALEREPMPGLGVEEEAPEPRRERAAWVAASRLAWAVEADPWLPIWAPPDVSATA